MSKTGRSRERATETRERKLSVMVIHRIKDTMSLAHSIQAHKARLAAALEKRYSPRLREGEALPDYVLMLELTARDVKAALAPLLKLDDAVDYAAVALDQLRQERDRLVSDQLYPRAVAVRGAIDLAFGREQGGWLHGMKGRTERKAQALEYQLRPAVLRLTDPGRQLPQPKNPHAVVDREGWSRQLESLYRQLVKLNRQVGRRQNHALPALVAEKQAAMAAFDVAYGDALRLVTAGSHMARLPAKLIKNLKPYYQRRRLSRLATRKGEARATPAAAVPVPAATSHRRGADAISSPAREPARVTVSKTVAKWLQKNRLFGT